MIFFTRANATFQDACLHSFFARHWWWMSCLLVPLRVYAYSQEMKRGGSPLPSTFFTLLLPLTAACYGGEGEAGFLDPRRRSDPPSSFCAIVIMGARHATDLGGQFFPLFSEGSFFLCSLFLASFYVLSLIKTRKKMKNKSLGLQQRSPT